MQNIILSKTSSENEIRNYFKAILKLSKSNKEFPVSLEEVWPLVYSAKNKAVEALKRDFIENEDYKLVNRKVEQVSGAKRVDDYFLSISCLEYFIVKKVRPVFEVYRKVFHKTVENIRLNPIPTRIKTSLEWVKGVREILNLNDSSTLFMLKQVGEPLGLPLPNYTPSQGQLLSASELLSRAGSPMTTQDFNKKMIAAGYITVKERPSSRGTKSFKSITPKGSMYGENQVCPNNPKETQPLYYEDKFDRLLESLEL